MSEQERPFKVKASSFGASLARAMGLDPSMTTRIVLDMGLSGAATATVTMYVDGTRQEQVERVFSAVEWREAPQA